MAAAAAASPNKAGARELLERSSTNSWIIDEVSQNMSILHPFPPGAFSLALVKCCNCHNVLCSSIYQCQNHHVACEDCWKTQKKWCSCSGSVESSRNEPLERLVGSFFVITCFNLPHGCREEFPIRCKAEHETKCSFRPIKCVACEFIGSGSQFPSHFTEHHGWSIIDVTDCTLEFGVKLSSKADRVIPIRVNSRSNALFVVRFDHETRRLYTTRVSASREPVRISVVVLVKGSQELCLKAVPHCVQPGSTPPMFLSVTPYCCQPDGDFQVLISVKVWKRG